MKINCVIMDGLVPVTDYLALAEMARSFPADVRFIEAMPFGSTPMPALNHLDILKLLSSRYPDIKPEESERGFGPAVYYRIPVLPAASVLSAPYTAAFAKAATVSV